MIWIYHKPGCTTSVKVLRMLQESGKKHKVIEYIKETPSREALQQLVDMLGIRPVELVRKKEKLFSERFSAREYSDQEWIQILHENPVLIQRPILVRGKKAMIARPPESAVAFLK